MESITKPKVTEDQIARICRKHLGDAPVACRELTDGWFNAAFRVELVGANYILKVAPSRDVKVLRYERQMMAAEASATRFVRDQIGFPAPEVIAFDQTEDEIESDYLLIAEIEGQPLERVRKTMSEAAVARSEKEIGALIRTLHSTRGTHFGTFGNAIHSTWRAAFEALLADLRQDAEDAGVALPANTFEVVRPHLAILDTVETPCFVHWDLFDPNVFVDPADGGVTGIIDFERAMWADPLIEARFMIPTPALMEGYGRDPLEEDGADRRRALYNLYLALIMVIETTYRRFDADHEQMCRRFLDGSLKALTDHD